MTAKNEMRAIALALRQQIVESMTFNGYNMFTEFPELNAILAENNYHMQKVQFRSDIMELTSIQANGHKVIASGTVIGYSQLPEFSFNLKEEDSFEFTLKMIFEEKEGADVSIHSDVAENNITIHCVNFKNSLGSGFTKPVELATVGGKKIYFKFIAHDMKQLPVLDYTFYEN